MFAFSMCYSPCGRTVLLLCFLIVGIHASGIFYVVRVKSYVTRLFHPTCVPVRLRSFLSFQCELCPVSLACSETAHVL